jgi:hypothetical protein
MKRLLRSPIAAAAALALILGTTILAVGLARPVLVLDVGDGLTSVRVSAGDVLTHTYRHSMYEVPVSEKIRIDDEGFRLFHVVTESDAALWYLGLEKRDEHNVDREFGEFTVPAASIGVHVIRLHDRDIPLGTGEGRAGKIRVKILKMPYVQYLVGCGRT